MTILKRILSLFTRLFYKGIPSGEEIKILGSVFFMQKIIGFNRFVPWPMHFTSRVLCRKNIKLGKRSFPGWSHGCYIQGRNGITIGNNLRMGANVGIISANHNSENYDSWNTSKPIIIGNNVWIGMNTVILPEVNIGDNVIIGANSVVTNDIPSNVIAAGNPCKVIKDKPPYNGHEYS